MRGGELGITETCTKSLGTPFRFLRSSSGAMVLNRGIKRPSRSNPTSPRKTSRLPAEESSGSTQRITVLVDPPVGEKLFDVDVPGLARHAILDKESSVASGKQT